MTCWLRFLKLASDLLKEAEPDPSKRKSLAISILKDIEKEEGHDPAAIGRKIESEGKEGLARRARRKKRKIEESEEYADYGQEAVEELSGS